MAQCKRILDSGERCSNQVVPGLEYCAQHRRIQFRPVSAPPPLAPPPKKPRQRKKRTEQPVPPPNWVAQPSAAGTTPAFPGLRADARNILVGPQGLIWLSAQGVEDQPGTLFDRQVRLLACLSQEIPLPGHVTLWNVPEGSGSLILLTPPHPEVADLSRLYDAVAGAASLSGGLLYIGQDRAFIQYRDASAPRGYDTTDVQPPAGEEQYLIDRQGTHPISPQTLHEEALDELLLHIAPLPARSMELPAVAFALVASPLYRMVARYFRDHHLRYRVARFHTAHGDTRVLFEITSRPDAPAGTLVPAFVLAYLSGLPRCVVLTEVGADVGRRMLVEWGQYYPCLPRHILEAFPSDSLLLFTTSQDFPNLCVTPVPPFFEGDALISVHAPRTEELKLTPVTDQVPLLELPVRLAHDPGPTPSTAALILDADEMNWVRRLLYRLPGDSFNTYTFCMGQEQAVLVGEGMPIESLPFGLPLRRLQDTELFMPLRTRLAPDLPWLLLAKVLEIREGVYTFLTPECRFDIPRSAFVPLSRALVAEPGRPRVTFEVRPIPNLPVLRWTPPAQPERLPVQPGPPKRSSEHKWGESIQRLLKQFTRTDTSRATAQRPEEHRGVQQAEERPAPQQVASQDFNGGLRKHAEVARQQGDYLSAALCFALAGDHANAARCYQEAARRIGASVR